jgi:hypothetical protein
MRLIDPFDGVISEAGRKVISTGWQGVLRHFVLHHLPALRLGDDLSDDMGRPSSELHAMCGLLLIREFQNWTVPQTLEAVLFRSDVQYALNLEPGFEISQRTIERYIARLQDDEGLAAELMATVTDELVRQLELTVSKQRLDSTHIISDMAVFGRTRMMGVALKRFLAEVKRRHASDFAAVPEELRRRYEASTGSLFADAKTSEQRQKSRQQAAADLHAVIEHFADHDRIASWTSYLKLRTMFEQQCEVVESEVVESEVAPSEVVVRKSPGGDVMLNPSDPDATYCGRKGSGYQVQLSESCGADNEVELILGADVETACVADAGAVESMLDELGSRGHQPQELLADCGYGSDGNVELAKSRDVDLISPVPGGKKFDPDEVTAAGFTLNAEHEVTSCPAGHAPVSSSYNESSDRVAVTMSPELCSSCPLLSQCPVRLKTGENLRGPSARVYFTMSEHRSCHRREAEQTPGFRDRYRLRSGIEGTNGSLKRRCGLGRLRVRGMRAVTSSLLLKVTGWNILRAACSSKLQALLQALVFGCPDPATDQESLLPVIAHHDWRAFPFVPQSFNTSIHLIPRILLVL